MWLSPLHFQCLRAASIIAVAFCAALPVRAQEPTAQGGAGQDRPAKNAAVAQPKKPPKPYGGGSPLDVLLHLKLWETPPAPKTFVKDSREPTSKLHYQPTIGTDPKRPQLLSHDQLNSLQGELEQAGAQNEKAAGVKDKNFADVALSKAAKSKARKGKAEKAKATLPIALHAK